MTLDLRDNYMDGGDGPAEQERPANPAPSQARKEEDGIHGLLGIIASAAIAAAVCVLVFTAGPAMKNRNTEENEAYREKMGGAECYPLWDGALKNMGKKSRLDNESFDKMQKWMSCMKNTQEKNAPAAVQPKQIPRARSNL